MIKNIMPYHQWIQTRKNPTALEIELYFKIKEAYQDISENGYVYSIEQKGNKMIAKKKQLRQGKKD